MAEVAGGGRRRREETPLLGWEPDSSWPTAVTFAALQPSPSGSLRGAVFGVLAGPGLVSGMTSGPAVCALMSGAVDLTRNWPGG